MSRRIGVWTIGAFGDVATCMAVGIEAIKAGLASTGGLVTELDDFASVGLVPLENIVFGGYDIRRTDLAETAARFAQQNGAIDTALLAKLNPALREISANVRDGLLLNCGEAVERLTTLSLDLDALPLRQATERIGRDINEFRERHELESVVVINLASAEAGCPEGEWQQDLDALRAAIANDDRGAIPAGVLYAYAAMENGFPYINFTSSLGSSCPAMDQLANLRKVPHMGKDGKTGETLVKTVLAPLFAARNLKVHSWESHNILGNRDGAVLNVPANKAAKLRDKNEVLRKILKDDDVHSNVRIDYVPSLGDWKTAWNFIHFSGFLDVKMSLQFTWQGADSILAAPLAIDLVRLADLALVRGEKGSMPHLASFFKNPYGVEEHDFARQFDLLEEYARTLSSPADGRRVTP
ncbi:MAG: hypothetical protein A2Z34_06095 [Planctomycetes bacterium RBG_16_59_8]|nr:MAG: hypothetical protein A2Z34_06095 [Planctomycetes bacterium RBG_16_59_8]